MSATLTDIQEKYGESVYPLYKDRANEPYTEDLNGRPLGVVLYDEAEDRVICLECGERYERLTIHILKEHWLTTQDYKDKYGIPKKAPLQNKRLSMINSSTGKRTLRKFRYRKGIKNPFPKEHRMKLSLANQASKKTMSHKNLYDLCPEQIKNRLCTVVVQTKKNGVQELTNRDLYKYDLDLYTYFARETGSFEKACKEMGIKYLGQLKYADSDILAALRTFVMNNKKMPRTKADLGREGLPSYDTIKLRMGSYRRAQMMAGLDQLLLEVKVQ